MVPAYTGIGIFNVKSDFGLETEKVNLEAMNKAINGSVRADLSAHDNGKHSKRTTKNDIFIVYRWNRMVVIVSMKD